MTYGYGAARSPLEEAFALVEEHLRSARVTYVLLEYSEGVEMQGPGGGTTKATLFAAYKKVSAL